MEVNGTFHKFLAADNSHPLSKEIYSKLDEIVAKLKSSGHVTNKSLLLQLVDEEDMKEQALNLHSEKLAIAFGLISTSPSQPIRIVKNLRVCGDCHTVAKLISKLYNRKILLRDRILAFLFFLMYGHWSLSVVGISVNSLSISSSQDTSLDWITFETKDQLLHFDLALIGQTNEKMDLNTVKLTDSTSLNMSTMVTRSWSLSTIANLPFCIVLKSPEHLRLYN
ncbi:hypothetical protein EZV62_002924 [Acer yangbiense]|uniref:DYW domain-containing protein n=1 Tax=Acer yangbiense TaxID=1000413 RepID=A0A5C7IYK2_9ROSI|nr:hypothetical protein EZV62_002924 [Acer yangbiense]